jgi:four helix bundle protein
MKKILIANRGEIAIRIAKSSKDLGLKVVGIYSEDDIDSLHISKMDESFQLKGKGAQAYLDIKDIVSIAINNQIDLVHPGYGFLADQLRRAVSSIPLNFAEGYGKRTPKEQRRFFMIARGSTNEVAAILDVGLRLNIINKQHYHEGMELCDHLARMLTCFRRL